jgi:DNA-binding NtrC family response regulator
MSVPGGIIEPSHLSPEIGSTELSAPRSVLMPTAPRPATTTLASAVDQVERDLIQSALNRSAGNISRTARSLGLTRRGLYLKLRRLGLESRATVDLP